MSLDQWIDLAATLPIQGLEFYSGFLPEEPSERARVRERLREKGLSMPMLCCSPDFTDPDPQARAGWVEQEKRWIDAVAELGGVTCRVLSGQRRPGVSRAEGVGHVVDCLRALLPHAQRRGVVLVLENHYKDNYWQYPEFAQRMDVFLEILDAVPSPWLGVNYDPSNALIAGDDPLELLEAVAPRVVTMHASDRYLEDGTLEDLRRLEADPHTGYASILKHGVIGRGMNDFDRIFSVLRDAGFRGWVSIEDGPDPETGMRDLRESAEFLNAKMREHGLP